MMSDPGHRAIIVAPSFGAAREICILGESGLMNVIPPDVIKNFNRGTGIVYLKNGSQAKIYGCHSLEDAQALRGPQSHTLWFEELAHCRHQTEAFDNGIMGNRLGSDPRVVITSTPRPTPMIRKLFKFEESLGVQFPDLTCRIQGGSTFDNASNLPLPFLAMLESTYKNTRLGAQELEGLLLEDVVGALWNRSMFRYCNASPESMGRIVIGVDPPGSHRNGAECGIAVVGRQGDSAFVFEDASFLATPEQWSTKVLELYDQYQADCIVLETSYGGDLAESTMRGADRSRQFKVKRVTAIRGKALRAEPSVNLYERGKVFHVGAEGDLAGLEQQMCTWVGPNQEEIDEHGIVSPIPPSDWSPDRIDSAVYALTDLLLTPSQTRTLMRFS